MNHSIDKSDKNHPQTFGRFCLVGGVNTVLDFTTFAILYFMFDVHLLVAHVAAFSVATLNSYIMNKYWTFKEKDMVSSDQFVIFFIVTVSGLVLSSIAIYFSARHIGAVVAKLLAIIVTLIWNYAGSRIFVFKER